MDRLARSSASATACGSASLRACLSPKYRAPSCTMSETPTTPTASAKQTERERALARIAAADATAKTALAKAAAEKAAARKRLAALDAADSRKRRAAETRGLVVLGVGVRALAATRPTLIVELAATVSERDRAHLVALGWLS